MGTFQEGYDGWGATGSVSVSESSGSIVNQRMFERSAPAAPGGGLDRAWMACQAHDGLLFEKEGGEGRAGGGLGGGLRRGYREADQLRLLDNIVRGKYDLEESTVSAVGADFISKVGRVGGWGGGGREGVRQVIFFVGWRRRVLPGHCTFVV